MLHGTDTLEETAFFLHLAVAIRLAGMRMLAMLALARGASTRELQLLFDSY